MPEDTAQAPAAGVTPQQGQAQESKQEAQAVKFDEWLASQDAPIKAAYEEHTTGLRNTVKATRDERDALSQQVKDLLKTAAKGSEMEKSLQEFQGKLEAAERRAAFLEAASQPGVDCRNPKAALAIAQALDLFDRRGSPDWTALKAEAPELFGRAVTAPANAGQGVAPAAADMNAMIRQAAGR
jgi:valyl-tRNA synthetase